MVSCHHERWKAMPVSYALDQLRNQAGTNYDPDLIETFCSIEDADGNIRVPEQIIGGLQTEKAANSSYPL